MWTVGQLCLFWFRFSHRYWLIKTLQIALTYQILASLSFFSSYQYEMYLSLKKVALFVILNYSICLQLDNWYIIPSAAIYFFASYIPKLETYAITVRKWIFGMSNRCLIYFDRALFLNHCISYSFSLFYSKWLLPSILSSGRLQVSSPRLHLVLYSS